MPKTPPAPLLFHAQMALSPLDVWCGSICSGGGAVRARVGATPISG